MSAHPGDVLREALADRSMSQAEFAKRMGLTTKHVNQIIRGRTGFTATVAVGMEHVLGISAAHWLRLQAEYRLALARATTGSGEAT